MGIRNLMRWIQWVTKLEKADWSAFRGSRIGIDILGLLYKAKATGQSMLGMVHNLIDELRALEIEPVCVFDGKTPKEKQGTRSARRRHKERLSEEEQRIQRVSTEDRNQVKQLLYAKGVLSFNAEQEADTVLAFLAKRKDIAAVITSDMDFLPRGVEHILLPSHHPLKEWKCVALSRILEAAELSYDAFVELCVLMGCDYAPTLPTISYQSAYWMIRRGRRMLEVLEEQGIRTATPWIHAIEMLRGERDRWEDIVSERQREKWMAGPPPKEPNAEIIRIVLEVQKSDWTA
jgi:5'-3' exonuclease